MSRSNQSALQCPEYRAADEQKSICDRHDLEVKSGDDRRNGRVRACEVQDCLNVGDHVVEPGRKQLLLTRLMTSFVSKWYEVVGCR